MKPLFKHILLLALGLGFVSGAPGEVFTNAPGTKFLTNQLDEINLAATNSLIVLRRHINASNFQLLGFSNATEAATATLGKPMLQLLVPFPLLTNYQPGADFSSLILPTPAIRPGVGAIVPIMVGADARTAITLRAVPSATGAQIDWVEGDWGHPQVIRNIIATSLAIPAGDLRLGTEPFVVRLPIPRVWLLGYLNKGSEVTLLATADIPLGAVIHRNEVIPKATMQIWAAEARRYNPGFPN